MKNRDWEEQLQEGPYLVRAEQIQIRSIQERVLGAQKKGTHSGLKWIASIALILVAAACLWIVEIPVSVHPEIPSPIHSDLSVRSLSDQDILQIIEQSSPDPDRTLLYKENAGNNGLLIFTAKQDSQRHGMTWEVGYINGGSQSWTKGGEVWVDFVSKTQVEKWVKGEVKNPSPVYIKAQPGTPFPILYGDLTDPWVSQIHISDNQELQQNAKIIKHAHGGNSLWFASLPIQTNGALMIEYLDIKGNVIGTNNLNVESSGTTEKGR